MRHINSDYANWALDRLRLLDSEIEFIEEEWNIKILRHNIFSSVSNLASDRSNMIYVTLD